MDIEYLTKEILPQREIEIAEGKNLGTCQPIYVVLDLREHYASGHNKYASSLTNLKGQPYEYGYIDAALECESMEFCKTDKRMEDPKKVTKFYTDKVVAFFLTSKGANEYKEYQKHNLTKPYVYVFYSGYGNIEMDNLLKNG